MNNKVKIQRTRSGTSQVHWNCKMSKEGNRNPNILPKSPAADQNPSLLPSFSGV